MDNRKGNYINYYTSRAVQTTGWGAVITEYGILKLHRTIGFAAAVKIDVYNSQLVRALLR